MKMSCYYAIDYLVESNDYLKNKLQLQQNHEKNIQDRKTQTWRTKIN